MGKSTKKEIRISFSTGKPFDPYYQRRTTAMEDLLNSPENKAKNERMLKGWVNYKKEQQS